MKILSNYFANPLSVIIATLFTFINFLVILLPFHMTLLLFFNSQSNLNLSNNIFIYTMIFMFIFTLIYLCLDFYFGFTIKSIIKDCTEVKTLKEMAPLQALFVETLEKFELSNVTLLLKESDEVNAFAVLSLRKKYVIITTGMLSHVAQSFDSDEAKLHAFKGLIAHELSHLLNWDSLPNLILISGQVVAVALSNILTFVANIIIQIISYIPAISLIAVIASFIFMALQFCLNMVYKYLLQPLYLLVERFLGRVIEHRSDYQSAKALNWEPIYFCLNALMTLHGNTFNSSFSTHPSTINRILHIYKTEQSPERIEVPFFSKYFSLILIFSSLVFTLYILFINYSHLNYLNEQIYNFGLTSYESIKNFFLYIHQESLYLPILGYTLGTFLIVFMIRHILYILKVASIMKNLNHTEDTPIDFLLLYAIKNNDLHSFVNVLKAGANINAVFPDCTLESYAQEVNTKFIPVVKKFKAATLK